MYTLAVCAEMVYRDLPIEERARRVHEAGFQVEIWDCTRHDLNALARTPAEFSSMTGYIRGTLTAPDGAAELLATAEESIKAAEHLGCPRLNLHGTGLDSEGLPVVPVTGEATGAMWSASSAPRQPDAMKGTVARVVQAGIPVVGFNSGVDDWKKQGLLEYFGQDETVAGEAVGK
ncbi:hypothetical protein EDD99_6073 [Streptomyces sp. 846.5]|nr:hypothetical protein EDD99_6073 [Streptomyces sp. 846.5]